MAHQHRWYDTLASSAIAAGYSYALTTPFKRKYNVDWRHRPMARSSGFPTPGSRSTRTAREIPPSTDIGKSYSFQPIKGIMPQGLWPQNDNGMSGVSG